MATETKKSAAPGYRKKLRAEIDAIPDEYLSHALLMMRTYRQAVLLKPAAASFRQGWREAMNGETFPIEQLWEGVDAR